jgi:hypothetical protein
LPYPAKFKLHIQLPTEGSNWFITYFPTVGMHRASGGSGAFTVYQRPAIPVPYLKPDGDFTLLVGDWYRAGHTVSIVQISVLLSLV